MESSPTRKRANRLRPLPSAVERPKGRESEQATGSERSRLVVELNRRSTADLAWLTETEELNKTTVVNRAIQVYADVIEAQLKGRAIAIVDPATGQGETLRIY